MKIFFLLIGDQSMPSVRERVLTYLPYLKRKNIEVSMHIAGSVESGYLGKIGYYAKLLREAGDSDIVFIHRLPMTKTELNIIRSLNKNIIFDFDDAIFTNMDEKDSNYDVINIISRSSLLIAGNNYLAERSRGFNSNIVVIPTCVDTDAYKPEVKNKPNDTITIGWIGVSANLRYLTIVSEALKEVMLGNRNAVFKIVSDSYIDISGVEIIKKRWSLWDEPSDLQSFDIGIMPLTDGAWTRGKCAFKALIYMATGIPVVISPVGTNNEVIADGVEGYFANSKNEWIDRLNRLIKNRELRQNMGAKGRESVVSKYSKQIGFKKLCDVIRSFT